MRIRDGAITRLRVVAAQATRDPRQPDPASSILKIKGTELQQATTELLLELAGPNALPARRGRLARNDLDSLFAWADAAMPTYLNHRKVSIYGGSNELQHNVIAKAVLGL